MDDRQPRRVAPRSLVLRVTDKLEPLALYRRARAFRELLGPVRALTAMAAKS